MRAQHGADWWKKAKKPKAKKSWSDRSRWPEWIGDSQRMVSDDQVRYGWQDDDGRATVVIKETGPNSYHLKGESEENWLSGEPNEIEYGEMERSGLTHAQAIKAVKEFIG
jgi:hypothetical protein